MKEVPRPAWYVVHASPSMVAFVGSWYVDDIDGEDVVMTFGGRCCCEPMSESRFDTFGLVDKGIRNRQGPKARIAKVVG